MKDRYVSFVIPVFNEEESLRELFIGIDKNMQSLEMEFEVIFIDDGSSDNSWQVISELVSENREKIKALRFRQNCGKAAGLAAGFQHAKGDIVFTMDADLQDDPNEISRFIDKLDEGYDLVSGWKKVRHDPWHKVLPSRVFNKMLSALVDVHLHDHNCGFKCYRGEVVKDLALYGEMHRMVPSLASIKGYRSTEIIVKHHARKFGYSKYGVKRFLRGLMDMITVAFLKNYQERPLHLLGGTALICLLISLVLVCSQSILALYEVNGILVLNSIATILMGAVAPLFGLGLLSELIVSSNKKQTTLQHPIVMQLSGVKASERKENQLSKIMTKEKLGAVIQKKAVVVDDDPKIRRLLEYQLNGMGFSVLQARDGREALERIDNDTTVVLMDMMMPEMDGLSCLAELRKHNTETEVIMVSAVSDVSKAVTAIKGGASDFVSKPFMPEDIENVVSKVIN